MRRNVGIVATLALLTLGIAGCSSDGTSSGASTASSEAPAASIEALPSPTVDGAAEDAYIVLVAKDDLLKTLPRPDLLDAGYAACDGMRADLDKAAVSEKVATKLPSISGNDFDQILAQTTVRVSASQSLCTDQDRYNTTHT